MSFPKLPSIQFPRLIGVKVTESAKANEKLLKAHGLDTATRFRKAIDDAIAEGLKEIENTNKAS